jgi:hypothetical protein
MIVDVEDGDALGAGVAERLGRDRRVVEEAIAAVEIAARMVPRRTAQREHRALAGCHQPLPGQRDLRGRMGRAPGAGDDRRAGVDRIVAEPAVDRVRHAAVFACR